MDFDTIANRLIELEYEFLDAFQLGVDTQNFEPLASLVVEHNNLILSIKKHFIDNPVALIPDEVSFNTRSIIQEILLSGKSPIEILFAGTPLSVIFDYKPDDDELEELASKHFLSWFSHYDYVNAILDTAAVVLRANSLPPDIRTFLHEMRQCFAFKKYLATIVLCRTSLELGVLYIYNHNESRITVESNSFNKSNVNEWPPPFSIRRERISTLREFKKFNQPLRKLYHELSRYAHGQHHVNQKTAKQLMAETIQLLHDLYEA